jgi:hypothetical protein
MWTLPKAVKRNVQRSFVSPAIKRLSYTASPINLANTIIMCPNCKTVRLFGTGMERDENFIRILWYHKYGDYCEDLFDEAFLSANRNSKYLAVLKELGIFL